MSDYLVDLFPAELPFRALGPAVQLEAQQAASWLINRIVKFAPVADFELTNLDRWILGNSPYEMVRQIESEAEGSFLKAKELERSYRQATIDTVNDCVVLAREAMVYEKRTFDVETVVVRPGLRVPAAWHDRYELLSATQLPWTISIVMQNALLINPLAGEKRPWRSR